jgi:predicted DCC family thiol-disulfide oxidoreductase YuxK
MAETPITVFYDGDCGLCHGLVRFLIARDRTGDKFDFAPLQSEFCSATISQTVRRGLPDSVVIRTPDGSLLIKSAAVLYVLKRIGRFWRIFSMTMNIVPTAVLDFGYDFVARMRRRLFSTPTSTCPLVPTNLQNRFRR